MTTQELARKLIDDGWIDELSPTEQLVTADLNLWLQDGIIRKPYSRDLDKTKRSDD